ncbi:MAG: adenosylmethionine--8-amino-7-oxononanoate transaminase [Victivallales bacterium]|nr:adenosylmethionine--8-amino-7-oxononanoate transaminase [Victivallales bacterium]
MKDYEGFPPLHVVRAEDSFLYTSDSRRIIDAISSWWCKSLGHGNLRVSQAVKAQLRKFEHVIMANTCNDVLVELSERLCAIVPELSKVFYADNGSTAVEIAMKMSLQYHRQCGSPERTRFASLENGYHGETVLALAAGDCSLYSSPFKSLMPEVRKIVGLPYVSGPNDEGWEDMGDDGWENIRSSLDEHAGSLAAVLFEPVLQGAGGMRIYSPDFLGRLSSWASANGVHLIADEILTGFGRTGRMLACMHAGITPDFVCLSKGLTAGWGPMSAVLTSDIVYDCFYSDYNDGRAFMHSNTYCGHALSAAAALEALKIYEDERIVESVSERGDELVGRMRRIAENTSGALTNVRGLGFVAAADITNPDTGKPFPAEMRKGFECYKNAVALGALLRPIGDTIYFLPPLNTPENILDKIAEITQDAVNSVIGG